MAELHGVQIDRVLLQGCLPQQRSQVPRVEAQLLQVGAVIVHKLRHELVVSRERGQVLLE